MRFVFGKMLLGFCREWIIILYHAANEGVTTGAGKLTKDY
jgi:hypothetical protein